MVGRGLRVSVCVFESVCVCLCAATEGDCAHPYRRCDEASFEDRGLVSASSDIIVELAIMQ